MTKFLLVTFSVISCCVQCWSQTKRFGDSTSVFIGFQGHLGSILPHSSAISNLTKSYLWGYQADVSRIRTTRSSWNACSCYSQNGISVSYFNFNNPEVLGNAFNIAVFAEPQFTRGRFNLSVRGGAGVSYLTRVFHPQTNPENLFFSTPWSGLLLAQINGRYKFTSSWLVRVGASYQHISNGGQRQPNKGMNFPTVDVGMEYALEYIPLPNRMKLPFADKAIRYYVGFFYNTRSIDESDFHETGRKPVFGVQGGFYVPFARMHAIGAGLEASRDGALRARARHQDAPFDHHVVSALARHHFIFGRFDFSQALGIYLHKEYPTPSRVFQRYALQYRLWKRLNLGFSLKAHLHTAEQMDVRIGYVF